MPFAEKWFFDQVLVDDLSKPVNLHYYPELIITSCANARYWSLFKNTSVEDNHYQDLLVGDQWYQKSDNILRFLNGILVTKIRNKTCPVGLLPSFKSVCSKILN